MGTASAQEEKPAKLSQRLAKEDVRQVSYGRNTHQHTSYEDDSAKVSHSRERQTNRMSHQDRQMLRQQVNEAGKTLYSQPNH